PELALKVRNFCPQDLPSAYRTALMLESNQMIVKRSEENVGRRRDGRVELRANVVTAEDEGMFERLKSLEEKINSYGDTRRPEKSERTEQVLAGLLEKLTILEKRLEERAAGGNNTTKEIGKAVSGEVKTTGKMSGEIRSYKPEEDRRQRV